MARLTRPQPLQSTNESIHTLSNQPSLDTLVSDFWLSELENTLVGTPICMQGAELPRSVRGESRIIDRASKASQRSVKSRLQRRRRILFNSFVFLAAITAFWAVYCAVRYGLAFNGRPDGTVERQAALAFAILSVFAAILLFLLIVFFYHARPSHFCHQSTLLLASLSLLAPCVTGVTLVSEALNNPEASHLLGRCRQDEDILWRTHDGGKCTPGVSIGAWMVGAIFRLVITLVILGALHLVLYMLEGRRSPYPSSTPRPMVEGGRSSMRPLTLTAGLIESKPHRTIPYALPPLPNFNDSPSPFIPYLDHRPPPPPVRYNRKTRSSSSSSYKPTDRRVATHVSHQDPDSFAPVIVNGKLTSPSVASRQETSLEDESVTDSDIHLGEAKLQVAVVRPASRYDRPRYYELPTSAEYNQPSWPFNSGPSHIHASGGGEAWRRRVSERTSPTTPSNRISQPRSPTTQASFSYEPAPPSHYKSHSAYPVHPSAYSTPVTVVRNIDRPLPPPPPSAYYPQYSTEAGQPSNPMTQDVAMPPPATPYGYPSGGAAVRRINTIASVGSRSTREGVVSHNSGGSRQRTAVPIPTVQVPTGFAPVYSPGRRYMNGPRHPPQARSSGGVAVSRSNSASTSRSKQTPSLAFSSR